MAQPRIVTGGLVGFRTGMYWSKEIPADADIDADNDGVIEPVHEFQIDLSKVASRAMGYQASMMSAYKIHRIKVGIRPVDDDFDNDFYAAFGINIDMYPATEHAFKALNLARLVEQDDESEQVDADSFFLRTQNRYTGFRYGWKDTDDDRPHHITSNAIAGMADEWYLNQIFDAYDGMTEPLKDRALFDGRAPEQMTVSHVASWSSGLNADASVLDTHGIDSGFQCLDSESLHSLNVLPLLRGQVKHSSGDEPGLVDDDYRLYVEIEFTPEVGGGF